MYSSFLGLELWFQIVITPPASQSPTSSSTAPLHFKSGENHHGLRETAPTTAHLAHIQNAGKAQGP